MFIMNQLDDWALSQGAYKISILRVLTLRNKPSKCVTFALMEILIRNSGEAQRKFLLREDSRNTSQKK